MEVVESIDLDGHHRCDTPPLDEMAEIRGGGVEVESVDGRASARALEAAIEVRVSMRV